MPCIQIPSAIPALHRRIIPFLDPLHRHVTSGVQPLFTLHFTSLPSTTKPSLALVDDVSASLPGFCIGGHAPVRAGAEQALQESCDGRSHGCRRSSRCEAADRSGIRSSPMVSSSNVTAIATLDGKGLNLHVGFVHHSVSFSFMINFNIQYS